MSKDNEDDGSELIVSVTWDMQDSTITAVGVRGSVYNERGLHLRFSEGRQPSYYPLDDDCEEFREALNYGMNFWLADGKEPEEARQAECKVAIVGTMSNGKQYKILGDGWVGRDNFGQIEGSFKIPPRIERVDAEDDLRELTEWD